MARLGIKSVLVLPFFLQQELSGIIALGYLKPPKLEQEDLDQARQLADQVAVAFSNARLIEELAQLNWGTLRALARAIDAKSHWTAGHSERSTKVALKIGRVMGLNREELDNLHRAGLLHDIGKLGIPLDVLDKDGKLTVQERQLMQKHPSMGARILEPIGAYAEVLPIVLQHHESFDGSGYPDGLSGKAISLGARIFALADRFEALTSDRPYRKALTLKRTIKYIKDRAGTEFDPKIVKAFLKAMTQEEKKQEGYR
jgi:putative nucleotidyltransferase with HDIG domain